MTARERATELLHDALRQPFGTDVPKSVAATIVNEIIAACGEETWSANHAKATEQAIEQLTEAQMKIEEQIGELVSVVNRLTRGRIR